MGIFYRDPKYDHPITNPLVDWLYWIWGGGDLVQKKRWKRRWDFNRKYMRWWYDKDHPARGVRAFLIMAALFAIAALAVHGRLVGAQVCLHQAGCVFTQDGGVSAAGHDSAPRVLTP